MGFCRSEEESVEHIECRFVNSVWDKLDSTFHARLNKDSIRHQFDSTFKVRMSKQVKSLWIAEVIPVFWLISKKRNQIICDDASFWLQQVLLLLWHCIQEADNLDSGTMETTVTDLMILKTFNVPNRVSKAPQIVEVQWSLPILGWIKINTDGAANESPGLAGCGDIFKTYWGFCKGCFAKPLGILYAYEAELTRCLARWKRDIQFLNSKMYCVSHIFREGNHVADRLATNAVRFEDETWWVTVPGFCMAGMAKDMVDFSTYRFYD
ncbi:uncharacterized protein LOC112091032 [Morus notabilis]|uniref:uncharacterized protein LOC112091032 n=1 Tax=Morus notabilis TaxID=981085 RepID=UPI000CED1816|nr:uncharacterized protein LOC112091032 [Morus notabilis]